MRSHVRGTDDGSDRWTGGGTVTEGTFAVLALLVLGWAVTSSLLSRVNINGPLLFTAAGYLLANPDWGPLSVDYEAPSIHLIAELTLALLLFADASRISIAEVKRDIGIPARLLGLGLPLIATLTESLELGRAPDERTEVAMVFRLPGEAVPS